MAPVTYSDDALEIRTPEKNTCNKRKRDAKNEELEAADTTGPPSIRKREREFTDKQDVPLHREAAKEYINDEQFKMLVEALEKKNEQVLHELQGSTTCYVSMIQKLQEQIAQLVLLTVGLALNERLKEQVVIALVACLYALANRAYSML